MVADGEGVDNGVDILVRGTVEEVALHLPCV
jgi:hypothetical protein